MENQLDTCGVSGKKFVDGDLYVVEQIDATETSDAYKRLVALEYTRIPEDKVEEMKNAGIIKVWQSPAATE